MCRICVRLANKIVHIIEKQSEIFINLVLSRSLSNVLVFEEVAFRRI